MAEKHHPGYIDKQQQDETIEALHAEYEAHVQNGRDDRAKQVAAYLKDLGEAAPRSSTRSSAQSREG